MNVLHKISSSSFLFQLKTTTLQIGAPAETHVNTYRERFYRDFSVLRNAFFENALAASEQKRAIMENSLIPPSTGTQGAHDVRKNSYP